MASETRQLVIFGATELAQVAYAYLSAGDPDRVVAFTVDGEHLKVPELLGLPMVPFEGLVESHPPESYEMLVAIGFKEVNRARTRVCQECRRRGYRLASYLDPRALHLGPVEHGDNCFILEANVIQPFVRIGSNVIIWSGNHIGHHSTIGDNCFIASHAVISGNVTIGDNCFIGVNATLRDGITVAPDCVIGAGALILADTEPGAVYPGSASAPARRKSWELRGF